MATIEPLNALTTQNLFTDVSIPTFLVYSTILDGRPRTGIWGVTDLVDFDNGNILTHEEVLPGKITDMLENARPGASAPVLLTYRSVREIDCLIHEICQHGESEVFSENDIEYQLWVVTDGGMISKIQQVFAGIPKAYVADGHHRLAAANLKADRNRRYLSSFYFSSEQLSIRAFHRLIRIRYGFDRNKFIEQLREHFNITTVSGEGFYRPDQRNVFGMCLEKSWYRLELKNKPNKLSYKPDVSILQEIVLAPLLEIKDARNDDHLQNFPDKQCADMLSVLMGNNDLVGFTLFPMTTDEFLNASDSGVDLPPKSTWIEPKIPRRLLQHAEGNMELLKQAKL